MSDCLVKVCGITRVEDAVFAVECGVEMVGLNFVPSSVRCITSETARQIAAAVAGRAEIIGVVANEDASRLNALRSEARVDAFQLHGDESPEIFRELSQGDFKAVRVAADDDVDLARSYPGTRILVDAKVSGVLGGSGHVFDWRLVSQLARERELILAGGLTPMNVGLAIAEVRPYAVDVASGVESDPGIKAAEKVTAFVAAARKSHRGEEIVGR
jgi:phosphoribosylanthranilate isomerase